MPVHTYKCIGSLASLQPAKRWLYGYSGKTLVVKGKCTLDCKFKDTNYKLDFYVVNTRAHAALGLQARLSLHMLKLIMSVDTSVKPSVADLIMKEVEDVFTGVGVFPGEHNIVLGPNVKPVVHAPRRIA